MKRIVVGGLFALVAATAIGVMLSGCATITQGSSQSVSITCNVEGATVFLDDLKIGTTPFQGTIKKGKNTIRVEMDGYKTATVALQKKTDGWFWGNIIFGGLVGSTTDGISGAAYVYAPATYQVDLQSNSQTSLEFEQQFAARKFAMIYIDVLSREAAANSGEHLSTLCELLGSRADMTTEIEGIRSALEASAGDPVRFGNLVVSLI